MIIPNIMWAPLKGCVYEVNLLDMEVDDGIMVPHNTRYVPWIGDYVAVIPGLVVNLTEFIPPAHPKKEN